MILIISGMQNARQTSHSWLFWICLPHVNNVATLPCGRQTCFMCSNLYCFSRSDGLANSCGNAVTIKIEFYIRTSQTVLMWPPFAVKKNFFARAYQMFLLGLINYTIHHCVLALSSCLRKRVPGWRRGVVVSGVRQWTKLTHVGPGYNWDGWPSSVGYTVSVCNSALHPSGVA